MIEQRPPSSILIATLITRITGVNTTNPLPANTISKHPLHQPIWPVPGLDLHFEQVRPDTATGQHVIDRLGVHHHMHPVVGPALDRTKKKPTPIDRAERKLHRVHVVCHHHGLELHHPAQTRHRIQRGLRDLTISHLDRLDLAPRGGPPLTAARRTRTPSIRAAPNNDAMASGSSPTMIARVVDSGRRRSATVNAGNATNNTRVVTISVVRGNR